MKLDKIIDGIRASCKNCHYYDPCLKRGSSCNAMEILHMGVENFWRQIDKGVKP